MTWHDVVQIFGQINQEDDGTSRFVASLSIEGKGVGPFKYEGTRRDDPNDLVPHENRRDLRGLYVFSAWLNNTDAKAGNTLDTIVEENGTRFIRHYLLDFGSALGSDGIAPKDPSFGYQFTIPTPMRAIRRILSLGLAPANWESAEFPHLRGIGNFEATVFDPDCWASNYPNPAFLSRLPDDDFWAAKQVMAFTDNDIRSIVETAQYSDPRSAEYMISILAKRRDRIGKTFFSKILPLDHFRVKDSTLRFDDLAERYGFHAARRYRVRWSRFDNVARKDQPIAGSIGARLPAEADRAVPGTFYSALIDVPSGHVKPVKVYIRKDGVQYKILGIERQF
jgi:hypothetical protein